MKSKKYAFTLVELLVVIGIIALLISILLPALNKARQAANTVKDLANLRAMGQGLQLYATQYNGYILGSPNTTGQFLFPAAPAVSPYSNSNTPGINGAFDWETPMLAVWGVNIPYSATADASYSNGQARYDRVSYELGAGQFTDPANVATCYFYNPASAFPGAANVASTVPYMSYCESMVFLLVGSANATIQTNGIQISTYDVVPDSYSPKVTKIGNAARKIFIADGSRYLSFKGGTTSFDESFSYNGTQGGNYADWGAYNLNSNGMRRACYPGNGQSGPLDERALWARHGVTRPGATTGYKFDAVFYDGHAETLTEEEGSNPIMWMPKGTTIPVTSTEIWPDVIARYSIGSTYTCPE